MEAERSMREVNQLWEEVGEEEQTALLSASNLSSPTADQPPPPAPSSASLPPGGRLTHFSIWKTFYIQLNGFLNYQYSPAFQLQANLWCQLPACPPVAG